MSQNNEEEDYKMQMYEARADAIQKQEENERLLQEIAELRLRLGEQQLNDSLVSQDSGIYSSENSLSSRFSSIEEQVTNAIAVITERVVSLQKNIRELSERGEETARNYRISQENIEKRIRDVVCEEMEAMKEKMNENRTKSNEEDGLQVLVIGGWDDKNCSSSIFLLDYHEKIWKQVSIELPYKVKGHGTIILDDQLYIIGGKDEKGNYYNTLYRLNKQIKWEKLADMHEKRAELRNSCLSLNGCIWVIGGYSGSGSYLNAVEKYEPATNRWKIKPPMKTPRDHAATAMINDKIYVCGGNNDRVQLDSVEVFDIDSEVWTDFCTLPAPRSSMSIIVDGTSIFLIGGYNNGNIEKTGWKMDVADIKKEWINLPPLNEGRCDSTAVRIVTGCILVFGGRVKEKGFLNFAKVVSSPTMEIFTGQKWEDFTPLPVPRSFHSSVVLTPAMIDPFRPYVLDK